jgi:AcrR family transcriptional regulator
MSAEERRAAILDAVLPLLRERGLGVPTRELARAAGIAEGTIFRVFLDKKALMLAALARALDFSGVEEELLAVPGPDLDSLVTGLVRVLARRAAELGELMTMIRSAGIKPGAVGKVAHGLGAEAAGGRGPEGSAGLAGMAGPGAPGPHPPPRLEEVSGRAAAVVAARLEPHAAGLNLPAEAAAAVILAYSFMGSHPLTSRRPDPEEVASVLLHGVAKPACPAP